MLTTCTQCISLVRWREYRGGAGSCGGPGCRVPALGTSGQDHHHEHLVQRAIQAGRQRIPRYSSQCIKLKTCCIFYLRYELNKCDSLKSFVLIKVCSVQCCRAKIFWGAGVVLSNFCCGHESNTYLHSLCFLSGAGAGI